jgi:hypothetical protein
MPQLIMNILDHILIIGLPLRLIVRRSAKTDLS